MAVDDETLREAASHRGLKLVRSRRRKPGVGDYGRFGLTDGVGKPLFGVGRDGLTASAQEIADFLRDGEVSTWAESAKVTPTRTDPEAPHTLTKAQQSRSATRRHDRWASPGAATAALPEPAQIPELRIRPARASDAGTLASLLTLIGFEGRAKEIGRAIAAAAAREEPILVADRGDVVGCLAWHIVPTLQSGSLARITAIVVAERARRAGIGRTLYEAATAEFRERRITLVEAMSEIAVRNANGFYRTIGLEQTGYRFAARP